MNLNTLTSPEFRPIALGAIVGVVSKFALDAHPAVGWITGAIVAIATFAIQNKVTLTTTQQ